MDNTNEVRKPFGSNRRLSQATTAVRVGQTRQDDPPSIIDPGYPDVSGFSIRNSPVEAASSAPLSVPPSVSSQEALQAPPQGPCNWNSWYSPFEARDSFEPEARREPTEFTISQPDPQADSLYPNQSAAMPLYSLARPPSEAAEAQPYRYGRAHMPRAGLSVSSQVPLLVRVSSRAPLSVSPQTPSQAPLEALPQAVEAQSYQPDWAGSSHGIANSGESRGGAPARMGGRNTFQIPVQNGPLHHRYPSPALAPSTTGALVPPQPELAYGPPSGPISSAVPGYNAVPPPDYTPGMQYSSSNYFIYTPSNIPYQGYTSAVSSPQQSSANDLGHHVSPDIDSDSAGSQRQSRSQSSKAKGKGDKKQRTTTGCYTCRARRIKCDEGKPACRNCQKGGWACDEYDRSRVLRDEEGKVMKPPTRPVQVRAKKQ
ncbi:hypothetical protein BJ508DRAFT_309494 [Ascobolus immersus RN42]|uniref:Zn(2)-C6 fungal-type domain-containing protein n=1 Tax=Ascobolus immersus RN42 TaxID=1160509 RepID=A0A3N4HWF0_ASCIM|nr:hypothetical protein BJ508DRAFT_309494 [Ascobolus immersus RN42]